MNAADDLVFGWKHIAEVVGCSERHIRNLVAERQLVADRRTDGAVGVRRADLVAIAAELGRDQDDAAAGHDADARGALTTAIGAPDLGVVTEGDGPSAGASEAASPVIDRRATDGQGAAAVFALFEARQAPVDVVVATKRSPAEVEGLYETWCRMKALDLSSSSAVSRLTKIEADLRELSAQIRAIPASALQSGSDPLAWALPTWRHDALAARVSVVEDALIARGVLVRRQPPPTDG